MDRTKERITETICNLLMELGADDPETREEILNVYHQFTDNNNRQDKTEDIHD